MTKIGAADDVVPRETIAARRAGNIAVGSTRILIGADTASTIRFR